MKIGIFKGISKFTPAVDAFCKGVEAHGTAYDQLRYNVPSAHEHYDVLVCCGFESAFRLNDAGIARHIVVIDACFINELQDRKVQRNADVFVYYMLLRRQ